MSNIMGKFKNILKQPEEEMEYDDYYDNEEQEDSIQQEDSETVDTSSDDNQNNVYNINSNSSKAQLVLFKPEAFDRETITKMADELINRHTVILNVEQTNKDVSRRIIDFLSGVAYAHSGKVSKVAEDTYIAMPNNVELSSNDAIDDVESDNVYF